jgi:hypothetical protein
VFELVLGLGAGGAPAVAERLARSIEEPHRRAGALGAVAGAWARAGEREAGRQAVEDAERAASAVQDPAGRARLATGLVEPLARAGRPDRALAAAAEAERHAHAIGEPPSRVRTLIDLVDALARAGALDRATALAEDVERLVGQLSERSTELRDTGAAMESLARLARDRSAARDYARERARTERELADQDDMRTRLAGAWARLGEHDRAERLALVIDRPPERVRALAAVATELARAGRRDRARAVLGVVLTLDDWRRLPFDLLADLAPEVLLRLAELVENEVVVIEPPC